MGAEPCLIYNNKKLLCLIFGCHSQASVILSYGKRELPSGVSLSYENLSHATIAHALDDKTTGIAVGT